MKFTPEIPSIVNNDLQLPTADELRRKLRLAGVVVLVLGAVLAGFVCWSLQSDEHSKHPSVPASVEPPRADEPLSFEDSKRDNRQVELYYGEVGVLTVKWQQRWRKLQEHPLAVAGGIMLIAALLACICFWLEGRIPDDRCDHS